MQGLSFSLAHSWLNEYSLDEMKGKRTNGMEDRGGFSSSFCLYIRHMHSTVPSGMSLLGKFILNEAGVGGGDDMWALLASNH